MAQIKEHRSHMMKGNIGPTQPWNVHTRTLTFSIDPNTTLYLHNPHKPSYHSPHQPNLHKPNPYKLSNTHKFP